MKFTALAPVLLAGVSYGQTVDDYADLAARLTGDLFLPGEAGFAETTKLKNPR